MKTPATRTVKNEGTAQERVLFEHECFGTIAVARSQGPHRTLFGSPLKHQHTITIEISRAKLERHMHRDHTRVRRTIVSFEMSEAQWAQHVSSIGIGSGVPITLQDAPPQGTLTTRMASLEQDPVRDTFEAEVRAAAREASEAIVRTQVRLAEMLKPGTKAPSKKDLEELGGMLDAAGEHFASNAGFLQRSFAECMEKTVSAAKTEVEAFVAEVASKTGLQTLKSAAMPVLIEGQQNKADGNFLGG